MKKYASYLACMSIVFAGLVASNNVEAFRFKKHDKLTKTVDKNSGAAVAGKDMQRIDSGDGNKVDNKKHKVRFWLNKKDVADKKDSVAFDALQTISDTKIDKGLGKLLESRDKIDQEIIKKVGKLDVGQYMLVDMFIKELKANASVAIDLANKTNDENGKITCVHHISSLYTLAENKKWNEFKHGLTEFGNITFASSDLNSLKENILSGIIGLFMKYFSHNKMNASNIVNVKSQPKILAIEDKKDNVDSEANTDTSVMLGSLTDGVSVHKQAHRPTKWKRTVANGERNGTAQLGNYRENNLQNQEAVALGSFLDDGVENVEGPFNVEYVDSPAATYSISDISGEKGQIAQVAGKQDTEGPFNVEYVDIPQATYSISNISGEKEQIAQMHNDVEGNVEDIFNSEHKNQTAVGMQIGPNGGLSNSQEEEMSISDKRKFFEDHWINPRIGGSTQR